MSKKLSKPEPKVGDVVVVSRIIGTPDSVYTKTLGHVGIIIAVSDSECCAYRMRVKLAVNPCPSAHTAEYVYNPEELTPMIGCSL